MTTSRYGGVFERPGDDPISPCLAEITHHELHVGDADVMRAMELLGLQWPTPAASDCTG